MTSKKYNSGAATDRQTAGAVRRQLSFGVTHQEATRANINQPNLQLFLRQIHVCNHWPPLCKIPVPLHYLPVGVSRAVC